MMKKTFFLLIVLLPLNILKGQSYMVNNDDAITVAKNWIRMNYPQRDSSVLTRYTLRGSSGEPLIYELTTDSITILLSGNKACKPILGYCGKNIQSLLQLYTHELLPCGLQSLLDEYVDQIEKSYRLTDVRPRKQYSAGTRALKGRHNDNQSSVALSGLW